MAQIKKKDFIKAAQDSMGVITIIAKRLGKTRAGVYYYLKRHPDMQEVLDQERDNLIDYAESKLIENVRANDVTSIIFLLKTIGKRRGYVERAELAGVSDQPIQIEVDVIKDNDETGPITD